MVPRTNINVQISRAYLAIVLKNNWCLSCTCVKIRASCFDPKNKHMIKGTRFEANVV